MTLRTLIVDDEPLARRRLARLLADADVVLVGQCGDGAAAVAAIEQLNPDLVLLDVQMPEIDGFGVLEALPAAARPVVVFVTAHDAYALRAFEVHALDYLLKPVAAVRLRQAVARAEQAVRLDRAARAGAVEAMLGEVRSRRDYPKYLLVRDGQRVLPVRVEEIEWAEARGKYVQLHLAGPRTYLIREGLTQLEARLDPAQFVRIHRSTLVNVRSIQELEPAFHGDYVVFLRDGTRLALSRSHRQRFHKVFGGPV